MDLNHPLRIGLIADDAAAVAHLRAYIDNPYVADVYLASTPGQECPQLTDHFGIIKRIFTDYHQLVTEESVDVVDVCLPGHLCHSAVLAGLQAGKDIIVEAPPAATLPQFDEMIRVAVAAGQKLFPVLWQRMLPAHRRAKELLRQAAIGPVALATITVYTNDPGRLKDADSLGQAAAQLSHHSTFQAIFHPVYTLQHFFGCPTAATAVISPGTDTSDNGPLDTAVALLQLPGHVLGTITVAPAPTGTNWQQQQEIIGTKGIILIRDDPEDEMPLVLIKDDDFSPVKVHSPLQVRPWAIARTLDHFIDCIVNDTSPQITIDEARDALATTVAICQAAEQQVTIQLPPKEE